MNRDPLCDWFEQSGRGVRPHFLRNTGLQLGWQFMSGGCEVAWRCEGARVWIVMFRRLDERLGLANPFAPLYLLAEAARCVLPPP
ncbi:MAG TPA: Low calcium response locus protein R, partial [Pseudomonas sp.]|nr:Low calcium response locus protein R [Pseudomonas sp.]